MQQLTRSDEATAALVELKRTLDGDLKLDTLYKMLYAQDASLYREMPLGVAFPRTKLDLLAIAATAQRFSLPLIPRGAGTSLTGQVVGSGLVIDLGRYMNKILEINAEERWVRVQPGVVRDELNQMLAADGLMFAPETSTSSRCMIGGMIANNSCGSNSIKYGDTRRHLLEAELLFADGTLENFSTWHPAALQRAQKRNDAVGAGLRAIDEALTKYRAEIEARYASSSVVRRNTGYPLDIAAGFDPYTPGGRPFSLPVFISGTEGTLAVVTEAKLALTLLPNARALLCAHFHSIDESLRATQLALRHSPSAVEIIDRRTLELARRNVQQEKNRFFIEGDPAAILAIQCEGESRADCEAVLKQLTSELKAANFGYAYPIIERGREDAVWELRKEGLGIVMGQPGDVKPETCIEDAAVPVEHLPDYIAEVFKVLEKHQTQAMVYGHASVGVIHLRPELNLKDPEEKRKFLAITSEVNALVRKYRGSLSGEHGDGRIRSPYLKDFLGDELMRAHAAIKQAFDPRGILNPGKILDPAPIDAAWRAQTGRPTPELKTYFDWSRSRGFVRAVEKCNGVGVCRRKAGAGGTMCPSYMATLDEKDSTRGRANVFQQLLYSESEPSRAFEREELREVLDLCISCKGCKRDCPSSVDMARMKAEFLQGYYDAKGTPLSAYFFGYYGSLARAARFAPRLANLLSRSTPTRAVLNKLFGLAPARSLPAFSRETFRTWFARRGRSGAENIHGTRRASTEHAPKVFLYVDPFTDYCEPETAKAALKVLEAGGAAVELLPVADDGRTLLSKGLLRAARRLMDKNAARVAALLAAEPEAAVVGVEPSALLTFRDEMPDLVSASHRPAAAALAERALLLEEYILHQSDRYRGLFTAGSGNVLLHNHCHQKALGAAECSALALELAGYDVEVLPTGCCGMAGSFGYEAEHYELSLKIGELVLFPALRSADCDQRIAAPGTSCRHQIKDGLAKQALHPAELIASALAR